MDGRFRSLSYQVTETKSTLTCIQNVMTKSDKPSMKNMMTSQMFCEKYSIQLPFDSLENFEKFDWTLTAEKQKRLDLVWSIYITLILLLLLILISRIHRKNIFQQHLFEGFSNVTTPIKSVLKKIFQLFVKTKEVLLKFTAQTTKSDKKAFNATTFCQTLEGTYIFFSFILIIYCHGIDLWI